MLYLMGRALKILAVLTLISVGVVIVLYVVLWLQGVPEIESNLDLSITEKLRIADDLRGKSSQETISPLVREAKAFALYLNPPQPTKPEGAPVPRRSLKQTISAVRAVKPEPKFRLVATCYYRSKPEESMALVSESGNEPRWVKQGARLVHFVVEKVKRGTIIYRDGDRLREMAVDTKVPIRTKQAKQTMLASSQRSTSPPKPSITHTPRTKTYKLLNNFGLQRPESRPLAYDYRRATR